METKNYFNDPFFQDVAMLYKSALNANEIFKPFGSNSKPTYPLDAWINDDQYVFEIPIINGKMEDVTITVEGDILRVKYVRSNKPEDGRRYITRGIVHRDFNLEWKLPTKLDRNNITPVFKNGLLTVFIPFAEEQKPKTIPVVTEN